MSEKQIQYDKRYIDSIHDLFLPEELITGCSEDANIVDESAFEIFMKGRCHVFSIALFERFGYSAWKISHKDGSCHYYGVAFNGRQPIYIDVRGMTSSFYEFIAGIPNMPIKEYNEYKFEKNLWSGDIDIIKDLDFKVAKVFALKTIDDNRTMYEWK